MDRLTRLVRRAVGLVGGGEPGYRPNTSVPWHGLIVFEGVPTADGRVIVPGALDWRDLVPLRFLLRTGETCPALVGHVEGIERRGGEIWASGFLFRTADPVDGEHLSMERVIREIREGRIFPAVDLELADARMTDELLLEFSTARIAAVTLVERPAASGVFISLGPLPAARG